MTKVNSHQSSQLELHSLVSLFYDHQGLGNICPVHPDEVPEPFRQLLVHEHHMTVTVEQYFGSQVDVDVLAIQEKGDEYSRKILLRRQSDQKVVQFGIVRLNPSLLDKVVWEEIALEQTPLGRVLINHNVMREVKLYQLYQLEASHELAGYFGVDPGAAIFGRTAMIFCDGRPAIELLEVVNH